MDTARTFKPNTILLLRKLERRPEAQRIIGMFPQAQVHVVAGQRLAGPPKHRSTLRVAAAKRVLMIGEASSFLRHFDGCVGRQASLRPTAASRVLSIPDRHDPQLQHTRVNRPLS